MAHDKQIKDVDLDNQDNIIELPSARRTDKPNPSLENIVKILCQELKAEVSEFVEFTDAYLSNHRRMTIKLVPKLDNHI